MGKAAIKRKVSKNISDGPQLKPRVLRKLRRASADYKAGKNISKEFSSVEDLAKHLGI